LSVTQDRSAGNPIAFGDDGRADTTGLRADWRSSGKILPCHAAETITGLSFERVGDRGLRQIWESSEAFVKYRGVDWMPEPCRSCDRREIDWGGCRCQAFALTGDAGNTDPACALSPEHDKVLAIAEAESAAEPPATIYRNYANAAKPSGSPPASIAGHASTGERPGARAPDPV
jgi:radical SAM protein with 4Fe4S-binding SPASM domain